MSKKPLIETNSHLRDSKRYRKALVTNVASSTAVETGAAVELVARTLTKRDTAAHFKNSRRSDR